MVELIAGKPLASIFGNAGTGTTLGNLGNPPPAAPTTTTTTTPPTTTTSTSTTTTSTTQPSSSTTTTSARGGAATTTINDVHLGWLVYHDDEPRVFDPSSTGNPTSTSVPRS